VPKPRTKTYRGTPVAHGFAVGKVAMVDVADYPTHVPRHKIREQDIEGEIKRLRKACAKAREELEQLADRVEREVSRREADLIRPQAMMVEDPGFVTEVEEMIIEQRMNAEAAVADVMDRFEKLMEALEDQYLRERSTEVRDAGRRVLAKRTGAKTFLAYFQAYTNTYDELTRLKALYDQALAEPDVIGLSIGTRPDCLPPAVLDLLADYKAQGHEIWLELGLQSAFDHTLKRVNRGHGFDEFRHAVEAAQARELPVCTHLIVGLPGEEATHNLISLDRVLALGVEGLKLHPLHVVKGTALANEWRRGEYSPWAMEKYIATVADLVERTPPEVIYHRLTGTAEASILLAPGWCNWKWRVLNGIEHELARRGSYQGRLRGVVGMKVNG